MPRNVAVVFTPDYSEHLQRLAFHTPVWIVETPENRAAAEEAWLRAVDWPHIDVTVFRSNETLRTLLAQVVLQHEVDAVDVIGATIDDTAREMLAEAGFPRVEPTADGFRARKS